MELFNNANEAIVTGLFIMIFEDKDYDVRVTGLSALRHLWDERQTRLPIKEHRNELVRCYLLAAALYCEPENTHVQRALLELLTHKNNEILKTASTSLESAAKTTIATLKLINKELKNDKAFVRSHLCMALCNIDPPQVPIVENNLITCLHDKSSEVRQSAAVAVGRLQIKRAIPELLTMFDDPDPLVSFYALTGIGLMGDKSPQVIQAILHAESRSRFDADDVNLTLTRLGKKRSK